MEVGRSVSFYLRDVSALSSHLNDSLGTESNTPVSSSLVLGPGQKLFSLLSFCDACFSEHLWKLGDFSWLLYLLLNFETGFYCSKGILTSFVS